ncbi:UNVERIFIED_CONTAM: hypothetical protein Sradi_3775700 [Sesamum radiatum]|uniref:Uncharacterized protein n=1 Tax=Sesamum radiatum TaxID=300843 RepID=A0AAW2PZM7_SESRA
MGPLLHRRRRHNHCALTLMIGSKAPRVDTTDGSTWPDPPAPQPPVDPPLPMATTKNPRLKGVLI